MSATIRIYDPTAPAGDLPQLARRTLDDLAGKTVGFIDNAKPNFNYLVDDLAELLVSRYGVAAVVKHRKRGAGAGRRGGDRESGGAMRRGDHRLRRLRVLHVVECPRQC